jgi:hypothetical protein
MIRGTLSWCVFALALGSGRERVPVLLLIPLLHGAVGGAFTNILVLLRLALGMVKNFSNCLLT